MSYFPAELDDCHGSWEDAKRRVVAQSRKRVELAKETLSWLTFATRQLTISELREALAIEAGNSKIKPNKRLKTGGAIFVTPFHPLRKFITFSPASRN
jgi:hypothetical protein